MLREAPGAALCRGVFWVPFALPEAEAYLTDGLLGSSLTGLQPLWWRMGRAGLPRHLRLPPGMPGPP